MQKVNEQLDFPIDTPSDAELRRCHEALAKEVRPPVFFENTPGRGRKCGKGKRRKDYQH